jgi:hypothetical protein
MSIGAIFTHRVRGVRLIEVWGLGFLALLVFGVYMTKTFAGREASEISRTQSQIEQEETHIRLLKAEVAYLEQPERIERLSQIYLHLSPMQGKRETEADRLDEIVRKPAQAITPHPMALAALSTTPLAPHGPTVAMRAEPIDTVETPR